MNENQESVFLNVAYAVKEATPHKPSYDEIMQEAGITSKSTLKRYINIFEKRGLLTYIKYMPRSIELTEKGNQLWKDLHKLQPTHSIGDKE